MEFEERYSLIKDGPFPEEVVLLQGRGCFWSQCSFCDYHLDRAKGNEAVEMNRRVLDQVTGEAGSLTAINSGSFFELPDETQREIIRLCLDKGIRDLSVEAHWAYREKIVQMKEELKKIGIRLHPRIGIETFDHNFRENVLNKGFGYIDSKVVSSVFDECCLLFGVKGQSIETLKSDLNIATKEFRRVFINIYEQRTQLERDDALVDEFIREILPAIEGSGNVTVMLEPTDLGVGD